MNQLSERYEDRGKYEMGLFSFSESRILLGSDNRHLISAISSGLLGAGFNVDTADDYHHLEKLWQQLRHEVVLFEVSHPESVESATASALRIKRQDAQQFIAYLADSDLFMSGLTGDAIFSRDARQLPQALRETLYQNDQNCAHARPSAPLPASIAVLRRHAARSITPT
jgi:CheY-like chemotaxis protein